MKSGGSQPGWWLAVAAIAAGVLSMGACSRSSGTAPLDAGGATAGTGAVGGVASCEQVARKPGCHPGQGADQEETRGDQARAPGVMKEE